MFTGIVEETGRVQRRERTDDGIRLEIAAQRVTRSLSAGDSVCVSGACLTAEAIDPGASFTVFLASETVDRTYLGALAADDAVNLERAMAAEGRFDGHIVQGHVDAVGTATALESVGEDWRLTVALPDEVRRYVVEKGSIALDGISLTVAALEGDSVSVAVIPTTYDLTTLGETDVGDPIHIEVDVIGKYVERLLESH